MTAAIIACVKQEERYIKEWIDYHTSIGFDHFFLADNNDEDYTPTLASIVSEYNNVTIIDCHGEIPVQPMCYNKIMDKYGNDYDWYAMIDVDEFINVQDIKVFLEGFSDADIVYLHWLNYGDNGLLHYENKLVQERFVVPQKKYCITKSIFRKKSIIENHIHEPLEIKDKHYVLDHKDLIRKDCLGNVYQHPNIGYVIPYKDEEYDVAYIRHYITKSLEEYMDIKSRRGDAKGWEARYGVKYFFRYNEVTDEKIKLLKEKYGITWNS